MSDLFDFSNLFPKPVELELPQFDPDDFKYENTVYKTLADDIAEQVNEKASQQIDALEKMADNLRERVVIAERDLELHQRELQQAQVQARRATIRSWIAVGISAVALLIEIIVQFDLLNLLS